MHTWCTKHLCVPTMETDEWHNTTDLVVLAHGHAGGVLSLALLSRHPLAGEVRRGERSGGVRCRVLPLLGWELTVRPVLLTTVTCLEERKKKSIEDECKRKAHLLS